MALSQTDPQIAELIQQEASRQATTLELIASENHVSTAVMEAAGTVLTNKYAEGYPGARYYGGCGFYDQIENLAIERAKQLFGCRFANVQPHSGANANLAAFMAMMKPGDSFISLNLASGGTPEPRDEAQCVSDFLQAGSLRAGSRRRNRSISTACGRRRRN